MLEPLDFSVIDRAAIDPRFVTDHAVISFPFSFVLAYNLDTYGDAKPAGWAEIGFGIILLSLWTNLLARTYAWMVLLQSTGVINRVLMSLGIIDAPLELINNLTGVTIGMVYIMLPFFILPLHATLRALNPATLQAAALCGAGISARSGQRRVQERRSRTHDAQRDGRGHGG